MLSRRYSDKDGKCFADSVGGCEAMREYQKTCGSYLCPFYKPKGFQDWIKIEKVDEVVLYAPEEYYNGEDQFEG